MKKILSTILLMSYVLFGYGQTSGLIAHWDMNGSASDITGNGHDGHIHNVTGDTGRLGIPNTAYYFNGTNSYITAGYKPDLNVTRLTICATIKVLGFYAGTCQSNTILYRGRPGYTGTYTLNFSDNGLGGSSYCSVVDSTADVFGVGCGTNTAPSITDLYYTPTIIKNKWYRAVCTFDGTNYKVYVNDTLLNTYTSAGVPVGTCTDSISIGYNIFEASSGYPYPFKGLIDDISIYNRVLADSEIVHYGDTCGSINLNPITTYKRIGDTARYYVSSSITIPVYQWQVDTGTGYVNLNNTPPYSGVFTPTLSVSPITTAMDSVKYRCIVSNGLGCTDTSLAAYNIVKSVGLSQYSLKEQIVVFPNPSENQFSVTLPYSFGNGKLVVLNQLGQSIFEKEITSNNTSIDLATSPTGVYILKVEYMGQVVYQKIMKR